MSTNVPILAVLVLVGAGWMIVWLSPGMLNWVAAKCLARRDGIFRQRESFAAHLQIFEGDE